MTPVANLSRQRIGVQAMVGPSLTYWVRGEPDPRSDATDAMVEPLRARVRDPLWFLARQWQLGEFLGADSGSPAYCALTERTGRVTGWSVDGGAVTPLTAAPLEPQCEREPFSGDVATRVEIGQTFERLLAARGLQGLIPAFRGAYPVADAPADTSDAAETAFRLVAGGRAIDGLALLQAAAASAPSLPAAPPVPAVSQAGTLSALSDLRQWVADTIGDMGTLDPVAWAPDRLEYALDLAATAPDGHAVTFVAAPGSDGLLDWSALDLKPSALERLQQPGATRAIIPAHVRFRGAPNARFWDFELAATDLGSIVPDKRDLARLAVMEFVLVHANDWFVLPLDMAPGDLHQVDRLLVRDVFGVDTLISRADREAVSGGKWSLFATSVAGQPPSATADFFVLAPSAASALQVGPTVEEVRFARDPVANMVWALEEATENALGAPWPGHERDVARNVPPPGGAPPPPAALPGVSLKYLIQTRVPEHWIPFLPVLVNATAGQVALERAAMLRDDGTPIEPMGRVLKPSSIAAGQPYRLPEEEVVRAGVSVRRVVCRSRWLDGSTRLWVMRERGPGAGDVNSALRFDQALPVA